MPYKPHGLGAWVWGVCATAASAALLPVWDESCHAIDLPVKLLATSYCTAIMLFSACLLCAGGYCIDSKQRRIGCVARVVQKATLGVAGCGALRCVLTASWFCSLVRPSPEPAVFSVLGWGASACSWVQELALCGEASQNFVGTRQSPMHQTMPLGNGRVCRTANFSWLTAIISTQLSLSGRCLQCFV